MHCSKVLWVLVIVLMSSVVQCQQRPRPNAGRPSLRNSLLGEMVMSTLNGARDMVGNIGRGMLRTMDPDGGVRGGGQPRRQRQRVRLQQGQFSQEGGQQGRLSQDDYDYYDNENTSFDYYDYSASAEVNNAAFREPVPAPPNLPFRNKIRIQNRPKNNKFRNSGEINNFRNSGERLNNQNNNNNNGLRRFNRPQMFNDIIERSDFHGEPNYPYRVSIGKKK